MKTNKTIVTSICALLIATLLTVSVGKVNHVYGAATTAAIAAAALALTGATVYAYVYFTGSQQYIKTSSLNNVRDKFRDIGEKALLYTTPQYIYSKAINWIWKNGIENIHNYDITLDSQTLEGLYQDFNNVNTIQEVFDIEMETPYQGIGVIAPTDTFNPDYINYEWSFNNSGGTLRTLDYILNSASIVFVGSIHSADDLKRIYATNYCVISNNTITLRNTTGYAKYRSSVSNSYVSTIGMNGTFDINQIYFLKGYDLVQIQNPPTIVEGNNLKQYPNWDNNNDDDYFPIVPYVELPDTKAWGINYGDLGDKLMEIGEQITELGLIVDLINTLAQSKPDQYIEYNVDDSNYSTYYTYNIEGDTYKYVQQNPNTPNLPIDMNQIKEYTSNKYITQLKNDGQAIGGIVADTFAVVHNIDYEILYILFGGAILTLICALIGKAGK